MVQHLLQIIAVFLVKHTVEVHAHACLHWPIQPMSVGCDCHVNTMALRCEAVTLDRPNGLQLVQLPYTERHQTAVPRRRKHT